LAAALAAGFLAAAFGAAGVAVVCAATVADNDIANAIAKAEEIAVLFIAMMNLPIVSV
jgi:hypothetical protein